MSAVSPGEEFSEQEVTYITEVDGRVIIIERVPARVSLTTGERLYSPETVERIQAIIWGQAGPVKSWCLPYWRDGIETRVFVARDSTTARATHPFPPLAKGGPGGGGAGALANENDSSR